jgi:Cu(I)/Ag(I) efflux system protein CusF
MTTRIQPVLLFVLAIAGFAVPAMAQFVHSAQATLAAKPVPGADAAMGEGLVKKIDKSKGTVTLAHGELPNGMPPMTMAYRVKKVAWLDTFKVGQTIRFATDPADGDTTVVRFELVK